MQSHRTVSSSRMSPLDPETLAMSWLLNVHPIRLFSFYLSVVFLVTTLVNIRDYRHILGLVRSLPGRWPRLLELLHRHAHIFMTWRTVTPFLASLGLLLVQLFVTRVVDPQADNYTVGQIIEIWPVFLLVIPLTVAMIVIDVWANWGTLNVDRSAVEKDFDQAEFWLKSWTAPVVRVLSLGYVNPRQMVAAEVRAALLDVSEMLHRTLWWTVGQCLLRIACGLTLWLTYALDPWLRRVMFGE
jgi:hypothetical protein